MKKLLLFVVIMLSVACVAENMTIIVGKGEGYLESIQEAINQANDGDIIYIKDGVYSENLVIKDRTLKIMGESPNVKITEEVEASPVLYIENSKLELTNLTIFASSTMAIAAINSMTIFKNISLILRNAIGAFLMATDTASKGDHPVALFDNVDIRGLKTEKRVAGAQRIRLYNNRGVLSTMDHQLYVFNSRLSYLQMGIMAVNEKTLISNSEFLANVVGLGLSTGNHLVISSKFHKAFDKAVVLMGDCKAELTGNSFEDNSVDLFFLDRSCDSCPFAKPFTGSIEGKFNLSEDAFVVHPEDVVLPSYFVLRRGG